MSDTHDREPIDQATIDCWRINYGLVNRTPDQAAQWWSQNMHGLAPSGCVAALGVALDELDVLRAAAHKARAALGELLATGDPVVYSGALAALDAALGPNALKDRDGN